jgi:hypothetical protein
LAKKIKFLENITEPGVHEKVAESHQTYNSGDFSNLLGLLSHKDENDDIIVVIWNLTLSFFLLKCLALTEWLPLSFLGPQLTDDEEYLILLLVHLRGVTQFNTHTMAEMMSCEGAILKSKEIGVAVRPTTALLNHSCWPNTVRCSVGHKVLIMAAFTIQPGEEVTDAYIQTFHQLSRECRQTKCKSYKFNCTCQACNEDWPLMKELPSALSKTHPSMFVKQMPVSMVIKLGKELHLSDTQALSVFAAGQTSQALVQWQDMCFLAEEKIRQPSRIFIIIRERIQACMWRMYADGTQKAYKQ